ncbi:tachylectin-related carbohydrate-binding protein [Chondromyces crocatus]|uniref:Tachylectin 2 domain-containing protein n=1 Tax=Chondromyces crocatus TaxID=52 RepID=A0A0K1EBI2_CHOCO|nr:tachylectin-related carbohydrate-binding protein [Chondromyces crocatus]AKT38204.1 uncharacterized protein CMC5_023470 [Chondromyces crocatus]
MLGIRIAAAIFATVSGFLMMVTPGQAEAAQGTVMWGGQGVIYGVLQDGRLQWTQHKGWQTGTFDWADAPRGGRNVGTEWNLCARIIPGGEGILYCIRHDGRMHWLRHNGWQTGTFDWTPSDGSQREVGTGWQMYRHVFSGGHGVFYGVHADGRMQWYRHDGWLTGTMDWTAGDGGRNVGTGWNVYSQIFSGGNGVIYGIKPDGTMQWYRHNGWQNGTREWTAGDGGLNVGTGWNMYDHVFPGANGVVYGIKPNGDLQWYRHDGWSSGTRAWTAGNGGRNVGTEWNVFL